MDHPYVGIRKNHMDQIKMDKKVNLAKMDFLSILFVGHFALALVIDSVETVIFQVPQVPPTHHNTVWLSKKMIHSHPEYDTS